jgi:NDP-sugar pyrophosphorylase family protein
LLDDIIFFVRHLEQFNKGCEDTSGSRGAEFNFSPHPNPPEIEKVKIDTINAGIYVLERKVLELIPENEKYSFEN